MAMCLVFFKISSVSSAGAATSRRPRRARCVATVVGEDFAFPARSLSDLSAAASEMTKKRRAVGRGPAPEASIQVSVTFAVNRR